MKGLLTKDRLVGIITVIVVVSFSFLAQAAGENKVGTEQLLEDWAKYWSSPNDIEKLLSLFTDDCVYEDVTSAPSITVRKSYGPLPRASLQPSLISR